MKAVTLKRFTQVKGAYHVHLGNGVKRKFTNRKECLKFLVDCSRFLTLMLIDANTVYSDLLRHYRRNWFYFDNTKNPTFELYEADRLCTRNLEQIQNTFNLMVQRSAFENGNHFVFSNFKMVFNAMKQTIVYLQALNRSKSNAVDVYELQVLYKHVLHMEREIFEFNGTFSKEQVDTDAIFTRNQLQAV